jgi:pilus assembly protein CpaC
VVLAPGRISLQLSSEVSELTNTGSFQIGNALYWLDHPGLERAARPRPLWNCPPAAALRWRPDAHNTKQVLDGFPGVKRPAGAGRPVPQPRTSPTTRPNWWCW